MNIVKLQWLVGCRWRFRRGNDKLSLHGEMMNPFERLSACHEYTICVKVFPQLCIILVRCFFSLKKRLHTLSGFAFLLDSYLPFVVKDKFRCKKNLRTIMNDLQFSCGFKAHYAGIFWKEDDLWATCYYAQHK